MGEDQFIAFVECYRFSVISVIKKLVRSGETARDLAQESFLRLWKNRNELDSDQHFFRMLYRIATNLAIDHLRKKKPLNIIEFPHRSENTEIISDREEFFRLIRECARRLKTKQQLVFILRDIEGLAFEEISYITEIPVENVRSNLYLARKNIKTMLESQYEINEEFFYEL